MIIIFTKPNIFKKYLTFDTDLLDILIFYVVFIYKLLSNQICQMIFIVLTVFFIALML